MTAELQFTSPQTGWLVLPPRSGDPGSGHWSLVASAMSPALPQGPCGLQLHPARSRLCCPGQERRGTQARLRGKGQSTHHHRAKTMFARGNLATLLRDYTRDDSQEGKRATRGQADQERSGVSCTHRAARLQSLWALAGPLRHTEAEEPWLRGGDGDKGQR